MPQTYPGITTYPPTALKVMPQTHQGHDERQRALETIAREREREVRNIREAGQHIDISAA